MEILSSTVRKLFAKLNQFDLRLHQIHVSLLHAARSQSVEYVETRLFAQ